MNKKAFSFVELLIVVSILVVLGVIVTAVVNNVGDKAQNSRVVADLGTIQTALINKQQNGELPLPKGNLNFFDENGAYVHDDFTDKKFKNPKSYGVYGKVTENLLAKKDLDILPLDPRTNNYYAYGITKTKDEFQLAGAIKENDEFVAKLETVYNKNTSTNKLIRQYNGADFVEENSGKLPYNPYEKLLVATADGKVYNVGDTIKAPADKYLEIYFGDGSIVLLKKGGSLTLTEASFPKDNALFTNIKLFLNSGVAWVKATKLADEDDNGSSFEVSTDDTNASVRGTMFEMKATDDDYTWVKVYAGEVELTRIANNKKNTLKGGQRGKVYSGGPETFNDTTLTPENFKEFGNPTNNKKLADFEEEEMEKQLVDDVCGGTYFGTGGCAKNNLGDEWKVVAYAPYEAERTADIDTSNIDKDFLGLYYLSGSEVSHTGATSDFGNWDNFDYNNECNCIIDGTSIGKTDNNKSNCERWSTKCGKSRIFNNSSVFIDNDNDNDKNDFIKYDLKNLDLGKDFAIEMSVKGSDLKRINNQTYYLFQFGDLYLDKYYNNLTLINNNNNNNNIQISSGSLIGKLNSNSFYNVITKVENGSGSLIIKDGNNTELKKETLTGITSTGTIYIGSKKNKNEFTKQWNGIIDYVKIYKK